MNAADRWIKGTTAGCIALLALIADRKGGYLAMTQAGRCRIGGWAMMPALTITELLASGHPPDHPLVVTFRNELA
jgi:hypothetical protein